MTTERDRRNQLAYSHDVGHAEGLKEGLKEGRDETKQSIARRMLEDGVATQAIRKYTGLSPEQIHSLE